MRDRLMRMWIEAEVQRLTSIRAQQLRKMGTPGPEGSIGKLAVAELTNKIFTLCVDIIGAEGMLYSDYTMTRPTVMGEAALGSDDDVRRAQGVPVVGRHAHRRRHRRRDAQHPRRPRARAARPSPTPAVSCRGTR